MSLTEVLLWNTEVSQCVKVNFLILCQIAASPFHVTLKKNIYLLFMLFTLSAHVYLFVCVCVCRRAYTLNVIQECV